MKTLPLLLTTLMLGLVSGVACAAPPQRAGLLAGWVAVDPALLDGELMATTRVQIPDIARMTAEQANDLARFNEGVVVQVGDANTFEPVGGLNGLVIQNTLDGQDIRALTTVNVGVDTLAAFQDLNDAATLHTALTTTSP